MIIKAANDDGIFSLSFFGHIIIMTITANPMHIVGISGWKPSVKYEINLVIARLPLDVTPKKLSSCPNAIITAIPEVNPVITEDGI